MTKMYIVYTLQDNTDFQQAANALEETVSDLPNGVSQKLRPRNDPEMQKAIPWIPFGDLVQILDFHESWQALEFETSQAYSHQKERTKGMFSNVTTIQCPLAD